MTKDEFLVEMQDVLQTDETLTVDTVLTDLAEWDSLAVMATMAFLDRNFGVKLKISDVKELKTIGDIVTRAGV